MRAPALRRPMRARTTRSNHRKKKMLDLQLLRKNAEEVAARLRTRGFTLDVAAFGAIEQERKQVQGATEELQARRNALSKEVGLLKARGEDTAAVMAEVAA